jgi:hypothetical protein
MSSSVSAPAASRPHIPHYGIPESTEGLLPWSYAAGRLEEAQNYWIATTCPDGRPHARPVWGVFVDGTLFFGGGPSVKWARNLAENPAVVVHLESGDEVVIVEGSVTKLTEENIDPDLVKRLDAAYLAKYKFQMEHGLPVWQLRPTLAFGWSKFPDDTTRWTFE